MSKGRLKSTTRIIKWSARGILPINRDIKELDYMLLSKINNSEILLKFNDGACFRWKMNDEEELVFFRINLCSDFGDLVTHRRLRVYQVPDDSLQKYIKGSRPEEKYRRQDFELKPLEEEEEEEKK